MEVWRGDLLFALADEDYVDGEGFSCGLEGVKGGQDSGLRAFGVGGSATDDHLAQAGLVDEPRFERRRGPLCWIELLDVIHEVDREPGGSADIDGGEDPRLARRWDDFNVLETCIVSELRHILRALRIVAILGGDRRQCNPILKNLYRGIVLRGDLRDDSSLIGVIGGEGLAVGGCEYSRSGDCSLDEFTTAYTVDVLILRIHAGSLK